MGFDISNHPVDVGLIKNTILPYIQGQQQDMDAFVERATCVFQIGHRANRWGLGVVALEHEIYSRQRSLLPSVQNPPVVEKPKGLLSRLFGKKPPLPMVKEATEERVIGIPGFNSDISVWGRPFFIVADSCDDALAGFDAYLSLPHPDKDEVDRIVRDMLARLDAKKMNIATLVRPEIAQMLYSYYPLIDHVVLDPQSAQYDPSTTSDWVRRRLERMRTIYSKRESNELIPLPDSDNKEYPARDLMASIPLEVVNISAMVLPGWRGCGYVWPTALFEQIGVDVSHLFEKPTWLFEALVRAFPSLEEKFDAAICDHYSLGGSVRPEKVQALVDLLIKHRKQLILAYFDNEVPSDRLEELASDFNKILEPAAYAARHGFGFIEAAEIYSGMGGLMN